MEIFSCLLPSASCLSQPARSQLKWKRYIQVQNWQILVTVRFMGVAERFMGITKQFMDVTEQFIGVAERFIGVAERFLSVTEKRYQV